MSAPASGPLVTASALDDGATCLRKLWYRLHAPAPPSPQVNLLRTQRAEMIEAVRTQRGPGLWLADMDPQGAHLETQQAIDTQATRIYGAVISAQGVRVRVDILERVAEGWHLVEVGAFTRIRRRQRQVVMPLALRLHLLREMGEPVTRCSILYLRRSTSNADSPFIEQRVTRSIQKASVSIKDGLEQVRSLTAMGTPPEAQPLTACRRCTFQSRCWPDLDEHSVFTVPWENHTTLRQRLLEEQRLSLPALLPHAERLPDYTRRYLRSWSEGAPSVQHRALNACLSDLNERPLHFLDFEAVSYPLAPLPGLSPWQPLVFQYSLHTLRADGSVDHTGYLHTEDTDPREALVDHLLSACGESGRIVVYSDFEGRMLHALGQYYTSQAGALNRLKDRLWDLHTVFQRRMYVDAQFKGSTALKVVADVLAPRPPYAALSIQNGAEAQLAFRKLTQQTLPGSEHQRLRDALWEYCKADTLAMVEIYQYLRSLPER